jgi:hypothetical protein
VSEDYDDAEMVNEIAGMLPSIIERLRRENPDSPIVKNIDACEAYILRRYGSIGAGARGVAYDEGGWIH